MRFASHPALFRSAYVFGALAVALVSMPSVAAADGTASAPIEYKNANCGMSIPKLKVIGTAYFERIGDNLAVELLMAKAPHNVVYDVQVWDGDCNFLGSLGEMTTDKRGRGEFSNDMNVAGETSFFITLYGGNNSYEGYNNSLIVELP